jgi:hypothetical protein
MMRGDGGFNPSCSRGRYTLRHPDRRIGGSSFMIRENRMAVSEAYLEFIRSQLASRGPLTVRRMFGGAGIYSEGVMLAVVADDCLSFKVPYSASSFERLRRFIGSTIRLHLAGHRAGRNLGAVQLPFLG